MQISKKEKSFIGLFDPKEKTYTFFELSKTLRTGLTTSVSTMPPKMAGKRQFADEDGNPKRSKETDQINEEELLKEDETSTDEPSRSEIANDSLEKTLANLNNNMMTVVDSLGSMSKALERFAHCPRPSKRQKREELSDSDTNSNDEANHSDVDSAGLLYDAEDKGGNDNNDCLTQDTKDDLMDSIASDLNADEHTGKDVSDKLAKLVNKRWSEKLTSDKLSEKLKKYPRPGNLQNLTVPKVNPEIWANMNHTGKQVDLRAANTQNIVSKVGSILAKCTDTLLTARNKKQSKEMNLDELIGSHTDALALLGHAQHELSMKRRDAIRPSLNKDYTGLCSQNVPITSLLFGDDLQQQLNTIKASNKITQASKSQRSTYKSTSNDNWKRKPSDQYYRRSYPLQNHWKNRGEKAKNLRSPL